MTERPFYGRRYRFASWLSDRFPQSCWVRLFDWSQKSSDDTLREATQPDTMCKNDRANGRGACWCGKFREATDG